MKRSGMTTSALAFLVVVLVVLGSVGVLALQRGTSGNLVTSRTTASSTSALDGLRLTLSATPTAIYPGGQVSVSIADWNTQATATTLTPPANATMKYALGTGPCSQLPLGIGLYQGNYGAGNLSAQAMLGTYKPGFYPCPAEFPVAYFTFAPNSDNMSLYSLQAPGSNTTGKPTLVWTQPDGATLGLSGYWIGGVGNASFHTFTPGVYTVVGEDPWGQEVVLHFQVLEGVASTTTSLGAGLPVGTSAVADSLYGLQLRVSMNATEISQGQALGIEVSEFNTLDAVNNVTKSSQWQVQAALGSCPNVYDQPFGVAVYQGYYDAGNVSQGTQLRIFPISACPMYIRLVTGYVFQPESDYASVLPGSGGSPAPLTGNVTVSETFSGADQSQPLPPGVYTVVGADEWGALAFLYFRVL